MALSQAPQNPPLAPPWHRMRILTARTRTRFLSRRLRRHLPLRPARPRRMYRHVPLCRTQGYRGTVRYGAVRYGAVRYGAVRYGAVRCGTVRQSVPAYVSVERRLSWTEGSRDRSRDRKRAEPRALKNFRAPSGFPMPVPRSNSERRCMGWCCLRHRHPHFLLSVRSSSLIH